MWARKKFQNCTLDVHHHPVCTLKIAPQRLMYVTTCNFFRLWMKGGTKELFLVWADSIYFSTNRHLSKNWFSFLFWHMCCLHRRLSFMLSERKAELAKVGRIQFVCTARNQNIGKLETRFNLHLSWSALPLKVECKTILTWQHPGIQKVVSPALNQRPHGRSQNMKFRHRCSFRVLIFSPDSSWKARPPCQRSRRLH